MSTEYTGRVERVNTLEKYSKAKLSDPIIWQMFGYELGLDAKQQRRALHWLGKSVRKISQNALGYRLIADIFWSRRRFEEAAELYRFASTLNDKDEQLAYTYFLAMRHLKREDEVVDVLADRVKRFGKQSSLPVRSLFAALRELGRIDEAFAALEAAIELRPDDGDLILFTADAKARYGRETEADELLRSAEGKASNSKWLRAAAHVSHLKGELETALSYWRKVLSDDPTATDAHENIAFLIKALEGSDAAKDHLRRACRKFPKNRSLQIMRLQQLTEEPGEAIAVLRDLIRWDPGDAWCLRELCNWYARVGKFDRALEMADQAVAVDPNDVYSRFFRGHALELLRRNSEAADEYRTAISLNVDYTASMYSWLGISRTVDEKRKVLEFVWQELNRQFSTGDGLLAYRDEARRLTDRENLLTELEKFAASNPRSWFAASAVVQQLAELGRDDDAIERALEATRRFPLLQATWLDLSFVYKRVGNVEGEIDALRTAISLNPFRSYGVQQLAETFTRAGRFEEGRDLLLDALTRMPFDNFLLGYLSEIYWELGEREKAIETAKRAVAIEPDYQWAWNAIKRWARENSDYDLPVSLARELTQKKPKDIRAWLNLADMLEDGAYSEERMSAAEKALAIDPYSPTGLAIKANTLADARRFDEAIAVAQTKMPDGYRPEQLRFVEAGIETMRGHAPAALDILIELTETSPSYLPGWLRLGDLYRLDGERKHEYRKVAMEIARLAPREAVSFGYLAEACLQLDLKDDARDALEQAVILDPSYNYAVMTLFDLYLEVDDIASADRLVETVRMSSGATGLPIAVELAVKKKDKTGVLERLRELLQQPAVTGDRLARVFEKVTSLFEKKDPTLVALLREVCESGDANPLAGRYLIERVWDAEKKKGCEAALAAISNQSALWSNAATRYMELLVASKPADLRKFIDANEQKLAAETDSWGAVGYQLVTLNDSARAMKWFSGWKQRRNLMPWMLWNYSIQLRRSGQGDEADRVNSTALGLPFDDTINLHLTMYGLTEFAKSNFDQASVIFSQINPSAMTNWDRFFYDVLNNACWAYDEIRDSDIEGAKTLVDLIVDKMILFDSAQKDQVVKDVAGAVLNKLLELIGSRWFSFRKKARLFYRSFS